jgi:transcriptional regulator with XRE-family HTH domain
MHQLQEVMMHGSPVAYVQQIAYTKPMTIALGSYLKTLRLRQGLSKAEVLRRMEKLYGDAVDRSTLYRAERGQSWPDSDFLTALLGIIGGRIEDLVWIRLHPNAQDLDGYDLAEKWVLKFGTPADAATVVQARSRADADEIADELEDLARKIRSGRE